MPVGATPSVDLAGRQANVESAVFGGQSAASAPAAQIQKTQTIAGGSTDAVLLRSGHVLVTTAGVNAMTLAAPLAGAQAAGGDDGKELIIFSTTAQAHTVTTPANKINGNKLTATFAAAIGNNIHLLAYNGIWYMISQIGITLT